MAIIIVEDGSVVSGANSYISEAELVTYGTDRGITLTNATDILIISAMDWLEQREWQGLKTLDTQPLQWPRFDIIVDGFLIVSTTIPILLKEGLSEVCLAIDRGESPLADIGREIRKAGAGSGLFIEFDEHAASVNTVRTINNKLQKLYGGGVHSGFVLKMSRG